MRPREEGHDDRVETSSYYTHSRARFESGGWGPIKKGSMSYFRTSYATLQELAKTGRYEDVAGFLVLARHASGWAHGQFAPYTLSGAGINSIHEKAGVSEEVARGVIERLKEMGAIRVASVEAKTALRIARWEINQGALDLDLPHALVDPLKNGTADSALHRVRKRRQAASAYASELTGVSDKELALDALMVLLGLYRNTKMCSYGGVSPLCIRRVWEVQSQTSKLGGIRWGAEPKTDSTYCSFMRECLGYTYTQKQKTDEPSKEQKARFWNAWKTMVETGLFYEAVSLYDADPASNDQAQLVATLRVNDFHAGAAQKAATDPSLLRTLELDSGSRFAYYTPASNDRGEPEAMWVILPEKRGALVGVWRPRFRASNKDTGAWLDQENEAIAQMAARIESSAPSEA